MIIIWKNVINFKKNHDFQSPRFLITLNNVKLYENSPSTGYPWKKRTQLRSRGQLQIGLD